MQAKQAAAAGKDAGSGYIPPSNSEVLFNRGTRAILENERGILDDALAQGKLLEPEMYRALGLEPVYDRPEDPEFANMSRELAGKQAQAEDITRQIADLRGKLPPGAHRTNLVKGLEKTRKNLNRDVASLTRDVESRGAVGRKVVGFKPIPGVADPTGSANGSFGGALDQFNASLSRALAGEDPIDPTLKTEFESRERELRERLRRQMGPDYETSTGGQTALANFDREKAEAFAQYNREQISESSRLAESRASALSSLTGARLQRLAFPSSLRIAQGQALEGAAHSRQQFTEGLAAERAAAGRGAQEKAAAEANARAAQAQAIGNLLAGVGSAAGTAGTLSGGQINPAPSNSAIDEYINKRQTAYDAYGVDN
jgi:hypothetical protein